MPRCSTPFAAICGALVGLAFGGALLQPSATAALVVAPSAVSSSRQTVVALPRPAFHESIARLQPLRVAPTSEGLQAPPITSRPTFHLQAGLTAVVAGTFVFALLPSLLSRWRWGGAHQQLVALSVAEAPTSRADDVLPESLMDAIECASRATAAAFAQGYNRATAEVLIEGFWDPASGPVFNDDGDNERWWELNRRYVDTLVAAGRFERAHVFLPDMGVVAMLSRRWPDAQFSMASIEARGSQDAVPPGTDLVVFAAADPTSAEGLQRIVNDLQGAECVALFNPRLASGDVGIGFNVRRLRETFLAQFVTAYSIRPLSGVGAIFKAFPAPWKLFVNDPETEGRYKLVHEGEERPAGDDLDMLLRDAFAPRDAEGNIKDPGLAEQIAMTLGSITNFMKRL